MERTDSGPTFSAMMSTEGPKTGHDPILEWSQSAGIYNSVVDRILFYRAVMHVLVVSANLEMSTATVDLACGTGLATRAIIKQASRNCTIYAVDSSLSMLALAKANVRDTRVQFIRAEAEELARVISQPVDRILCNAAFHLFQRPNDVLKVGESVLRAGGMFLFNVPDQSFDFRDGRSSELEGYVARVLPPKMDLMRSESLRLSSIQMTKMAAESGFVVESFQTLHVPVSIQDLRLFYRLPHLLNARFPGLAYEDQVRRLDEALSSTESKPPIYRWAQFALRKVDKDSSSN